MKFAIATIAALTAATGTSAASVKSARQSSDPYIAQVRIYGDAGCSADNQGFYPVYMDQNNQCWTFDDTVMSANLEYIADGCNFYLYSGDNCDGTRVAFGANTCDNTVENITSWGSFLINCPTSAAGK